ncbi:hypothetical protein RUM44_000002 [Polyplax serrata]|uniref:Uncharacterized protein n=1 Tax=Polyplax serrata TaxID=468196 RepID=A0ABR1B4Z3_POLSC
MQVIISSSAHQLSQNVGHLPSEEVPGKPAVNAIGMGYQLRHKNWSPKGLSSSDEGSLHHRATSGVQSFRPSQEARLPPVIGGFEDEIARALGKEECVLASALPKGTPSALQAATLEQLTELSNAAGNAILKAALRSQPRDAKSVIELLREELVEKTARLARVTERFRETAPAQLEIEEIVRRIDESMTTREEAIMARFGPSCNRQHGRRPEEGFQER